MITRLTMRGLHWTKARRKSWPAQRKTQGPLSSLVAKTPGTKALAQQSLTRVVALAKMMLEELARMRLAGLEMMAVPMAMGMPLGMPMQKAEALRRKVWAPLELYRVDQWGRELIV
jgi:hypothetical protein